MSERIGQTQLRGLPDNHSQPEALHITRGEASADGFALRDYLRVLFRHKWMIFATATLIVAATALYSFLSTPLYTAHATLEIKTYMPRLQSTSIETNYSEETRQGEYLNTQIARINSLSVADKALNDEQLRSRLLTYFNSLQAQRSETVRGGVAESKEEEVIRTYDNPVELLRQYMSLIGVEQVKKTSLVKVEATTTDPEISALVAQKHVQAFVALVRDERQSSTMEDMGFLETQAAELADKVAQAERDLATYAEQHAIVSLNKDENVTIKKLELLNKFLTEATADRITAEMEYLEADKGDFTPSMAFTTDSMAELQLAIKEAEGEYAMLSQKFKPAYPKMIQLKGKVDTLNENLAALQAEARRALKARYQAKLQSEQELRQQLEVQQSKAFELSRLLVTYRIMEREYESVKDLHQSVLRQLKEAQVSAQGNATSVAISEHATIPTSHAKPNRSQNIMLACLLGPMLGFLLALCLESFDTTFHSPRDIVQYLQLPSLGIVPMFLPVAPGGNPALPRLVDGDGGGSDSQDLAVVEPGEVAKLHESTSDDLITVHDPRAIASESFRNLRTSLFYAAADDPRVLLFTSSQKGEGKTTIISNLAVSLAEAGKKVLLVDADLRRPSLHVVFGLAGDGAGLSELLTGQREFERVCYPTSVECLSLIPAGTRPPNPSELIGSQKMRDFVATLKAQFDYVLIDTPPVLPVADALSLVRVVDGVVLTVRGQMTKRHVAQLTVDRLHQVGARVLGVVLNSVSYRSNYYYDYGSAYSYHYDQRARGNS